MKAVDKIAVGLVLPLIFGTAVTMRATAQGKVESLAVRMDRLTEACQSAEELSRSDIEGWIALCDSLIAEVSEGEDPKKRLYLFRLKQCRNYFLYLLGLTEQESGMRRSPLRDFVCVAANASG